MTDTAVALFAVVTAASRDGLRGILQAMGLGDDTFAHGYAPATPTPQIGDPYTAYALLYSACPVETANAIEAMTGSAPVLPSIEGTWGEYDMTLDRTLIDQASAEAALANLALQTVRFSGLSDEQLYAAINGDGTPERPGVIRGDFGLADVPQDV